MVFDLIIKKELDGYSAFVPSVKGWETWADTEANAIDKILEMTDFFLQLPKDKIVLDKARIENNLIIYKLLFDKNL